MGQLPKVEPQLLKLGYQIIAISADRPGKIKEIAEKEKYNYILISDSSMSGAMAFGLAYRVDDKMVETLKGYNMDIEAASGEKHHILPVPAAFVVGTDGVIKFSYINPDYQERINPDLLLLAAKIALQKN